MNYLFVRLVNPTLTQHAALRPSCFSIPPTSTLSIICCARLKMPLLGAKSGLWSILCLFQVQCAHHLCQRRKLPSLGFADVAEVAFLEGPSRVQRFAPVARWKAFVVIKLMKKKKCKAVHRSFTEIGIANFYHVWKYNLKNVLFAQLGGTVVSACCIITLK